MILKISDGDPWAKWWYYDKIVKVSVNARKYRVFTDEEGVVHIRLRVRENEPPKDDEVFPDLLILNEQIPTDWVTVCIVYFEREGGKEAVFAFNTGAYLLNDEGKTIERL